MYENFPEDDAAVERDTAVVEAEGEVSHAAEQPITSLEWSPPTPAPAPAPAGTADITPIGLWCKGLTYSVSNRKILENISVGCVPGELTMIMGPSGAGKTTLLNCLLNRVPSHGVEGDRGINSGFASKQLLKQHAHYVMQYDVTLSYLTVKETLDFSASLRMPGNTQVERDAAVAKIINWMELQDCKDTYCGGDWKKGISKGQMKRLAIAQELLGDPPILILDEPTTGLDSCLALELVSILRRVSRETKKTIIASIHQPSQRAFELFDHVILLSSGGLLYSGPAIEAVDYFASMGRKCPAGFSPPDFLLELATDETFTSSRVVKGRSPRQSMTTSTEVLTKGLKAPKGELDDTAAPSSVSGPLESSKLDVLEAMKFVETPNYSTAHELELMKERFYQREEHQRALQRIAELETIPLPPRKTRQEMHRSWRFEFTTLWKRSTLNTLRNPLTSFVVVIVNILQALILGALFFQLQSDAEKPGVTYTQIKEYSFWDSALVQFLAYGLDKNGTDPLMDLIFNGVNSATGNNLLFDIATDHKLITFFGEALACTRTLYEEQFFEPQGLVYPQWYWPQGSIDGNPQVTTTTTTAAPAGPTPNSRSAADPKVDIPWSPPSFSQYSASADSRQATDDDIPSFASTSLESLSNSIMGLVQILDYFATNKFPTITLPELENRDIGLWMELFPTVAQYASPLFCCLGLGFPAGMTISKTCEQTYNRTFPVLPGYQDSTQRASSQDIAVAEGGRSVTAAVKSWVKSDSFSPSSSTLTLEEIKEDRRRRNLMNPTAGAGSSITRKHRSSLADENPATYAGVWSKSAQARLNKRSQPAARRKLGSGLSGMVTDIWEQLFSPGSPLSSLSNNLMGWFSRFENDCDNDYCKFVVDTWDTLLYEATNLANSFLACLNIAGAIFFACANIGFSSYDVLLQFPKDRAVFNRERANGLYKTSSYFFAKMIADLPFQLIPCICWTIIFYFMVGLATNTKQFFEFLFICLLISFTCYSFGYMISALSARLEVAVVVAPLALVIMMTFAGFFVRDAAIPPGIGWLKYLSIYRWGFFSLNAVQFPSGGVFGSMDNSLILAILGVTIPQIWISVIALIIQATVFRILGYGALRWCNKKVGMEA